MPSTSRLLTAAVILGGLIAYGSLQSSAATGPEFIRITDRQFSYKRVDIGARGVSPGDQEIIYYDLFNRRITRRPIGSAQSLCTFTIGRTRMCTLTVSLPRGEIVATGRVRYRQFYELAITGGTRLYDDARGTLTITRTTGPPRAIRELLYFRLTG
jgi:hypothetical protein